MTGDQGTLDSSLGGGYLNKASNYGPGVFKTIELVSWRKKKHISMAVFTKIKFEIILSWQKSDLLWNLNWWISLSREKSFLVECRKTVFQDFAIKFNSNLSLKKFLRDSKLISDLWTIFSLIFKTFWIQEVILRIHWQNNSLKLDQKCKILSLNFSENGLKPCQFA